MSDLVSCDFNVMFFSFFKHVNKIHQGLFVLVFQIMSKALRFAPAVKELRLHLCQKSATSEGVRQFIEKFYVNLKTQNPQTPILIRECSNISPALWTRYEYGIEKQIPLTGMNAEQVLNAITNLTTKTTPTTSNRLPK